MTALTHYLTKPEHYLNAPIGTVISTTSDEPNDWHWVKVDSGWVSDHPNLWPDDPPARIGAARRRVIHWGSP